MNNNPEINDSPEILDLIEHDIPLARAGLISEAIGGYIPVAPGVTLAENIPALEDAFITFNYNPADGPLNPEVREAILSKIKVTPQDEKRYAAARETIDGYLELAELATDSDERFSYEMLARMEKPQLIPTVLHTERARVEQAVMQRFETELLDFINGNPLQMKKLFETARAETAKDSKLGEFPTAAEELQNWQKEFARGVLVSIQCKFDMALVEAVMNSLMHGNGGDPEKLVSVAYGMKPGENNFVVIITDQGSGFDPGAVPDPTAPENLERTSGRGVHLMNEFLSEVTYSRGGRRVTLELDFDTALSTAAVSEVKQLHTQLRREGLSKVEAVLTADDSRLNGLLKTLSNFYLAENPEQMLWRACDTLGFGYSITPEQVNFKTAVAELADTARTRAMTAIRSAVIRDVQTILRNEYGVDTKQPVTFEIGLSYNESGPQLVVQVAGSSQSSHSEELLAMGEVQFPGRNYAPLDKRVPVFSRENIMSFVSSILPGYQPNERIVIPVGEVLEKTVEDTILAFVKKNAQVENKS